MISPGVLLFIYVKYNIVNTKIFTFFIGPLQLFFLMNSCFSSSSINAKQKFWGVSHLLHMCVILLVFYKSRNYINISLASRYENSNYHCSMNWTSIVFYICYVTGNFEHLPTALWTNNGSQPVWRRFVPPTHWLFCREPPMANPHFIFFSPSSPLPYL